MSNICIQTHAPLLLKGRKEGRRELPVIFKRTNLGTRSCAAGRCSTIAYSQRIQRVRAPHTPAEGIQLDACTCCIYCYYRETRKKTRKTTVWKNGLASSKKDQNYFASCEEKLLLFCSSKDNFLYSLSTMLP